MNLLFNIYSLDILLSVVVVCNNMLLCLGCALYCKSTQLHYPENIYVEINHFDIRRPEMVAVRDFQYVIFMVLLVYLCDKKPYLSVIALKTTPSQNMCTI